MEPLFVELAKQVPALLVLTFLSSWFLRALREREDLFLAHLAALEESRRQESEQCNVTMKHLGDNCHAFQRDLAERQGRTNREVTEIIVANSKALALANAALKNR